MKRYVSKSVKVFFLISVICALILVIGIILIITNHPNLSLKIGMTIGGGMMAPLFLLIFFAERSKWLEIDEKKIVFPRGTIDNDGNTILRRTVIEMNEIVSLESKFHKGDKIFTGDCFHHTLKLTDGRKITFMLYGYGNKAEEEIIEAIQKRI